MNLSELHKKISRRIVFDRCVGIEDTVFLASMGRSGSTFLSNIINSDNSFRIMFEPFRFDIVPEAKDFVFPFYLRPDSDNPEYYSAAKKIILGHVRSRWIDRHNTRIFPGARLIKDIRANFFLKWIHNNFPGIRIILLLRHPCAVVSSWIYSGFGDGSVPRERLLGNHHFVSDMDKTLLMEYASAATDFERLVFLWCLHYYIPFSQFQYQDVHVVFYENFILNPRNELSRLSQALGRDLSKPGALEALSKPSATTLKTGSFFDSGALRIDQWRDYCSEGQVVRAFEIMKLFGMDSLYCPSTSTPNMEAAASLFKPKPV